MGPKGRVQSGVVRQVKGVYQVVGSVFPGISMTALASGTAPGTVGPSMEHRGRVQFGALNFSKTVSGPSLHGECGHLVKIVMSYSKT